MTTLTAKFDLQQALKMGSMGIILHGVAMIGEIKAGDYVELVLNGQPLTRQIGAVEQAGHESGGRTRLDLFLPFISPSDQIKFRPDSIGKGMVSIKR